MNDFALSSRPEIYDSLFRRIQDGTAEALADSSGSDKSKRCPRDRILNATYCHAAITLRGICTSSEWPMGRGRSK